MCFDVVTKGWKRLTSMSQPKLRKDWSIIAAERVGNHLYVAVKGDFCSSYHCYNIDLNLWEEHPDSPCVINNLCAIGDYMYAVGNFNKVPQRYSFSQCRWQPIAKLSDCRDREVHCYAGATVFDSKLYVVYGRAQAIEKTSPYGQYDYSPQKAVLYRFDPQFNRWEFVSNMCLPHFGSTLFVVNKKLCVAGGNVEISKQYGRTVPRGNEASVEVYNFDTRTWSVVQQNHIPLNNLGAIQVEGRVYFIINKFPIDSGIRIPPGEVYPVYLEEWENLECVSTKALLFYFPLKGKTLIAENTNVTPI